MKRRILVFFQIAMLVLLSIPAAAVAGSTQQIDLSLSKTNASAGDSVTASGTTTPEAWVPSK